MERGKTNYSNPKQVNPGQSPQRSTDGKASSAKLAKAKKLHTYAMRGGT